MAHERGQRVRVSGHRELLVLAQKELSQGHVWRAAARLVGWIQASPPGAIEEGDAQLLAAEFKADRMGPLLNLMPARETRTMLRRLDHTLQDPVAAMRHWRELQRLKRKDPIICIHRIGAEFAWDEDDETPSMRELLDIAKDIRETGHPGRAGAFLRMAASREPENPSARIDIGLGMLSAGMIEEGAAWILEAAQTLVVTGQASKAIPALRALLEADPSIREARRMLGRLKHLTVRRQLIRKNSMVGLGIALLVGGMGWVRLSMEENRELKMTEIANLIESPTQAKQLLEEYFPADESPRVTHLREMIISRQVFRDSELRNTWQGRYKEAVLSCSLGDPLEGLKLALSLPRPPKLETMNEPWPLIPDLFNGLAVHLENRHGAFGELELDGQDQVEQERALKLTTDSVLEHLAVAGEGRDCGELADRLQLISDDIVQRIKDRSEQLEARAQSNLRSKQDLMLAAARSHDQAGDYARSLHVYGRLIETDDTGRLQEIFAEELGVVSKRNSALEGARDMASQGQHEAALVLLAEAFEDTAQHSLPWTLEVFPKGALVQLSDGSSRPAPFIYESRNGETVEFLVEFPGHTPQTISIDRPQDVSVWLSKIPERSWTAGGRVDAMPVNVGNDQVVCDRTGHLARIGSDGKILWEMQLLSLGGIGRAPVSLPERPGQLLLVTEDGEAWLIDAETGEREGPWSLGSGPIQGPAPSTDGVLARLKDGRLMHWSNRLRPEEISTGVIADEDHLGTRGGAVVLRRAEAGTHFLDSPWNQWRVELTNELYRVSHLDDPDNGFTVLRDGDWSFFAWEAPTKALPQGRLWISDGGGLSAYLP
ncbi:MAG: hypothetical protein ACI9F9_003393 [Candidatus Paceibacteria bacterium]